MPHVSNYWLLFQDLSRDSVKKHDNYENCSKKRNISQSLTPADLADVFKRPLTSLMSLFHHSLPQIHETLVKRQSINHSVELCQFLNGWMHAGSLLTATPAVVYCISSQTVSLVTKPSVNIPTLNLKVGIRWHWLISACMICWLWLDKSANVKEEKMRCLAYWQIGSEGVSNHTKKNKETAPVQIVLIGLKGAKYCMVT